MLKIFGSIIIIMSTGVMGFFYSNIFYKRLKQIRAFEYALNVLEAEIIYTATPLSEAFRKVSEKGDVPIGKIFEHLSQKLIDKNFENLQSAFKEAIKKYENELYFKKEEIEVMTSFMNALGNTDVEGQKKNFNLTNKKLEGIEKNAEESRVKNERLYRYLGVCTGMLIVIILI